MNNSAITSDIISRRLGGAGQRPAYATDDAEDVAVVAESPDSSAGFTVMMLILFLAVGAGTYFFAGSDISWYEIKLAIRNLHLFK